ncbi:hypothetical protein ARMGADRAFT_1031210 [Armillaria gallica]|uniref:Uncharacterized protein n=1 Tax=Armillaria gallica TaxID=47427 RepID=A0A2H3DY04_ARMGA|nr:hypothetical protein ARMGADRAFT_1031210 [Armillaria gallica]
MSDPHYLLCAILKKAPALWDTEALDLLNNHQIASQVEGAHTLLMTYWSAFAHPYPNFIEYFFATASRTIHELPDRLVKGEWKVWLYGPDMVKETLKNGSFSASDAKLLKSSMIGPSELEPPNKCKARDPSLPAPSSQARTLMVMTEKPICKHPKQDLLAPSIAPSTAGSSSVLAKKSSAKDKKDSSAAPGKTPAKPHGRKPVKPPLVEVSTKPHKKATTPPPAILTKDTHMDIRGQLPTPVTMEYMLDHILTDLPTLMLPGVLCVQGAICFANTKSLWLPALTVIAGGIAPVGYWLMTCRRHSLLLKVDTIPMPWSSLLLHSEKSPEPSLLTFTMLKDKKKKKKKKRRTSEAARQEAKHASEEEQADNDQVKGALIDLLESSPIHPSKAAFSFLVSIFTHVFSLAGHKFGLNGWAGDLQTLVPDSELE